MSRRKAAPKREIMPDPLFHSELLAKFMNVVMRSGKKSVAERIVYGAFDKVAKTAIATKVKETKEDEGEAGSDSGSSSVDAKKTIRNDDSVRERVLDVFKEALDKVTPLVEVKSRRVGGSTYQVPVEIRETRQVALAMRWLVDFASKRHEKTMADRLAGEIIDAVAERGGAFKKREDVHRMAKANQAFAHYRF